MTKSNPLPQLATGAGLNKNRDYAFIPQNNATNQAAMLNTKRNAKKRPFGNQMEVSFEDVSAIFEGKSLGVPEAQLLDYVLLKHAAQSNHDNKDEVTFSLKDYMKDRGL